MSVLLRDHELVGLCRQLDAMQRALRVTEERVVNIRAWLRLHIADPDQRRAADASQHEAALDLTIGESPPTAR